jgi:hypothetical protein
LGGDTLARVDQTARDIIAWRESDAVPEALRQPLRALGARRSGDAAGVESGGEAVRDATVTR